jgi:hypothetical protein
MKSVRSMHRDAARRIEAAHIAVEQQRRHHRRIERRLAEPTRVARANRAEVEAVAHQPQDETRDVALRHKVLHARRQQKLLVNGPEAKMLAHEQRVNQTRPELKSDYSDRWGDWGPGPSGGCSCQDVRTWSVSNRHKHREGAAMKYFAGLDVSLEETAICVVDENGSIVREVRAASEPDALVEALRGISLTLERVGLEACSLTAWLHEGLPRAGLPAICIETRQANAAMKTMPNKTDRNDARALAQIMRTGWFRQVHVKSRQCRLWRSLLVARRTVRGRSRTW